MKTSVLGPEATVHKRGIFAAFGLTALFLQKERQIAIRNVVLFCTADIFLQSRITPQRLYNLQKASVYAASLEPQLFTFWDSWRRKGLVMLVLQRDHLDSRRLNRAWKPHEVQRETGHGGIHLWSQHLWDWVRLLRKFRASLDYVGRSWLQESKMYLRMICMKLYVVAIWFTLISVLSQGCYL